MIENSTIYTLSTRRTVSGAKHHENLLTYGHKSSHSRELSSSGSPDFLSDRIGKMINLFADSAGFILAVGLTVGGGIYFLRKAYIHGLNQAEIAIVVVLIGIFAAIVFTATTILLSK